MPVSAVGADGTVYNISAAEFARSHWNALHVEPLEPEILASMLGPDGRLGSFWTSQGYNADGSPGLIPRSSLGNTLGHAVAWYWIKNGIYPDSVDTVALAMDMTSRGETARSAEWYTAAQAMADVTGISDLRTEAVRIEDHRIAMEEQARANAEAVAAYNAANGGTVPVTPALVPTVTFLKPADPYPTSCESCEQVGPGFGITPVNPITKAPVTAVAPIAVGPIATAPAAGADPVVAVSLEWWQILLGLAGGYVLFKVMEG
jgi:hypothetical protein